MQEALKTIEDRVEYILTMPDPIDGDTLPAGLMNRVRDALEQAFNDGVDFATWPHHEKDH